MALIRSVRKQGNSLVVGIPSQVAALAGIVAGDRFVWENLGKGTLRLAKTTEKSSS